MGSNNNVKAAVTLSISMLHSSRPNSMSTGEVELAGTLRADGTVQLDQIPHFAPGRVTVVLRYEANTAQCLPLSDVFFGLMDEIWAGQKARGFVPRPVEDVEAEHQRLQAEAECEIEGAIRLQEESRRLRTQAEQRQSS